MITVVVGVIFAAVALAVPDLPVLVIIGCVFGVLIAGVIGLKLMQEIRSVLAANQSWVVTVSDDLLKWESPVPEEMASFSTLLDGIDHVEQRRTRYKNSKRSPKTEFFIHFKSGEHRSLHPQTSGIYPDKVFKELQNRSVRYEQTTVEGGAKIAIS